MSTSTHELQHIQGGRIEVTGLTKRFGSVLAVDDLTFAVEPGRMTGFLGPNGAGKTTTLRMLLGLIRPTSGSSTIGGRPYSQLDEPLRAVGAGLDGSSGRPGVRHGGCRSCRRPSIGFISWQVADFSVEAYDRRLRSLPAAMGAEPLRDVAPRFVLEAVLPVDARPPAGGH